MNEPQSEKELGWLHTCLRRGQPYGDEVWMRRTAVKLGLESILRPFARSAGHGQHPGSRMNGF